MEIVLQILFLTSLGYRLNIQNPGSPFINCKYRYRCTMQIGQDLLDIVMDVTLMTRLEGQERFSVSPWQEQEVRIGGPFCHPPPENENKYYNRRNILVSLPYALQKLTIISISSFIRSNRKLGQLSIKQSARDRERCRKTRKEGRDERKI